MSWNLIWSDEFTGPLDPSKWRVEDRAWPYDNELQHYRPENVTFQDGHLALMAKREDYGGQRYTAGRIDTKSGKFDYRYGAIEARMKCASGKGVRSAFWDVATTGEWPQDGERDVVEVLGGNMGKSYHTLHGATASGDHWQSQFRHPADWHDSFDAGAWHVYRAETRSDQVAFLIDGVLLTTRTRQNLGAWRPWPFNDHRYALILSQHIGGDWNGDPDSHDNWPQVTLVDYVRVYQESGIVVPVPEPIPDPTPEPAPVPVDNSDAIRAKLTEIRTAADTIEGLL